MQNSNLLKKFPLMITALMIIIMITGCGIGGNNGPELTDRLSVLYDGNGGFLGNKTFTSRKLLVKPGSKIPKYLQDYGEKSDSYVVPSLGRAVRDGYNLNGWYREEDATYQLNNFGFYIKLDTANGNGVYNLDDEGAFVVKYITDDNGEYIFVNIEDAPQNALPSLSYVYFEGTDGFGFRIYDDNDVNHKEAYENAENRFTLEEIQNNIGGTSTYYVYEYLEDAFKAQDVVDEESGDITNKFDKVLVDFIRYNRSIETYTEEDEGLDRYKFETGFVEIDAMMEERDSGDFVYNNAEYVVYDSTNVDHADKTRYQISDLFTPTKAIDSPSKMPRWAITIQYWDFEKDKVTEDIILKAHWVKKLTVVYTWKNNNGNVETAQLTTKTDPYDLSRSIDLKVGDTIGKRSTDPARLGYTFIGWSKVEDTYEPWNFTKDKFPEGTDTLTLYAYMIEGNYIKVSTAADLAKVANQPDAKYVLVNDIDLGGKVYTNASPLGFNLPNNKIYEVNPFTGEFFGLDFTISNYTININNSKTALKEGAKFLGLFPTVQGAKIERLSVENVKLEIDNSNENNDIGIAALIGEVLEGETKTQIIDVSVNVTYQVKDSNALDCIVYVGDIVAKGIEFTEIDNTNSTYNAEGISAIQALVAPANLKLQLLD